MINSEFEWDEDKSQKTFESRGFDFDYVKEIFGGYVLEKTDERRNYGETRIAAIGEIEGIEYFVIYTDRNGRKRIISARRANEDERREYQKSKARKK